MKCQAFRWMASLTLDSGRPLPAWARRHAAACACCRVYAARLQQVAGALERKTPQDEEAGPWLHRRIMAAVGAEAAPGSSIHWTRVLASSAAAVTIAMAIALATLRPQGAPTPAPVAHAAPSVVPSAGVPFDAWLDLPYEHEWNRLASDLAEGGSFLADCLGVSTGR